MQKLHYMKKGYRIIIRNKSFSQLSTPHSVSNQTLLHIWFCVNRANTKNCIKATILDTSERSLLNSVVLENLCVVCIKCVI